MAFLYKKNSLHVGNDEKSISLCRIFDESKGPFYVYDLDEMFNILKLYNYAFSGEVDIHFAMKANFNKHILKSLKMMSDFEGYKFGVDVVSGGEIKHALDSGFKGSDIVYSGVCKTFQELELAINVGVKQINIESIQELDRIIELSKKQKICTNIGIRLNPNVDANVHPYISTGMKNNKFGIDELFIPEIIKTLKNNHEYVRLKGIAIHIGSQILDINCFKEAIEKMILLFKQLENDGFELETFDVGGGVGIDYQDPYSQKSKELILQYGKMVSDLLRPLKCRIMIEPGRSIVGPFGALVGQVQYLKKGKDNFFLIIDTGMHHLIRPALYKAYHHVIPVCEYTDRITKEYDIVGPICESSDFLAKDRQLKEIRQMELLAILSSGAYGYSMSGHYNLHPLPKEYVISQGRIIE